VDIAAELRELARNLYWTWQPEIINVFRDLDPLLWRAVNHNTVDFLSRFSPPALRQKATELNLDARINYAFHRLRDYLNPKRTWGHVHAGPLRARPVAYFSAEFGLHESLPLYSGGLGVLAGDHLKSASDLGVPLVGVGLFYAQGYFNQVLADNGWQTERYFEADVDDLPLDRARAEDGTPLKVKVPTDGSEIVAGVWTAHVGRCRLILLDTDVEENSQQHRELTATLYGGDHRVRICQELILGVGGMRALGALGIRPSVLHLNEGHSAFAALELARELMERDERPFADVMESAAARTVFTTHTPVEAGHDRFDPPLLEEATGALRRGLGLSREQFLSLGRVRPQDGGESFCMTVLAMKVSRHINGVSAIHGRVSRRMWRSLWPARAESDVPIGHITNGVHALSWLSVPMARLYTRYLGQDWPQHLCYHETWAQVMDMDDEELWNQRQNQKRRLVNYVQRCMSRRRTPALADTAMDEAASPCLDPDALTIGFARRFAFYKRADLLLRDPERLDRIVNNPDRPVQIIYAGKAHPADDGGKNLIQTVWRITQDQRFKGKIVFIEDHDINVGRHMVQGVDLWINLPRRPMEACGTSGQKVLLNGGLNLSVLDGWWAEAYDGANGFAVGHGGEHSDSARQDEIDAEHLYTTLEDTVAPLYYDRDAQGIPRKWVARQKRAIRDLAWRFNADRMVMDYTLGCYMPAAGGFTSSAPRARAPLE